MPPKHGPQYALCQECGRPVTPKQTFKFTAEGGKIHYYCDPRRNPESDIRTLEQSIFEHAKRPTGTIRTVAEAGVRNEHGVLITYTVYTNRTHNRWWLEKLVGEKPDLSLPWHERMQHGGRSLHYEFATSSPRKAQEWIDQVNRLASGVQNPAGPTFHQAILMARAAGARIGDTSGFEPWLAKTGLDTRGPQVRRELEKEFWRGVEQGPVPSHRTRPAAGRPQVWQTEEGWKTALDPESAFDSREDAERFVAAQRNPYEASNPFDFETSAREFGLNIAAGKAPRVQVVKGWVRKAQKELDSHKAWLRSKGYGDDGVAVKMERKIRWWEIALQEYERARKLRRAS